MDQNLQTRFYPEKSMYNKMCDWCITMCRKYMCVLCVTATALTWGEEARTGLHHRVIVVVIIFVVIIAIMIIVVIIQIIISIIIIYIHHHYLHHQ